MAKRGILGRAMGLGLAVVASLLLATAATAQIPGPEIVAGDVLQMMVPGRPDLDRTLVVAQDGSVEIPQVGEVRLAGMGLTEAGMVLKQRLRLIAPTLDTVEVTRADAVGFRVYVIGEVGHAGLHEFASPPTVWDVVRAAGGPLRSADLRKARVIREQEGGPRTIEMDLSGLMAGRDFPLERLRNGDTIVVPALPERVSGVASDGGVKVFGGVAVPSIVPVDGPTPLMDVLMLAGSPTAEANMKKIWWVHAADGKDQARLVDLRLFLEKGDPAGNPDIHPGDTVNVTLSRPGRLQSGIGFLLGTAAAVAAIMVALNQVD
ncbi:MAG: SLBB domain-containing protein [bacterium]|nr:SLBB domain-containing protein [bacterium]